MADHASHEDETSNVPDVHSEHPNPVKSEAISDDCDREPDCHIVDEALREETKEAAVDQQLIQEINDEDTNSRKLYAMR